MKKLTDEELREPDVEYIVPDGTELPDEIRQILRLYIGKTVVNRTNGQRGTRYSIPAYLAREWLSEYDRDMRRLTGGD